MKNIFIISSPFIFIFRKAIFTGRILKFARQIYLLFLQINPNLIHFRNRPGVLF